MLGRHKYCCVIYQSQSYYKTPEDIRLNCSHNIIFESPSKWENGAISKEHGIDKDAYKRSIKNGMIFCILINQERLPKGILMRD